MKTAFESLNWSLYASKAEPCISSMSQIDWLLPSFSPWSNDRQGYSYEGGKLFHKKNCLKSLFSSKDIIMRQEKTLNPKS